MGNALADLLEKSNDIIIMDGGMGTTTEDRQVNTKTILWGSLALLTPEGRQINDGIHRDFATAGADMLIANTHMAFRRGCLDLIDGKWGDFSDLDCFLPGEDPKQRAEAMHRYILETAVKSARGAFPDGQSGIVATCIGSVDHPYATEASVSAEVAARIHELEIKERLKVDGDFIIFETLTTLEEIQGVCAAVQKTNAAPVAVGLTCGEDGRTLGGVSMSEVVSSLDAAHPAVWFIQCTRYSYVDRALAALQDATPKDAVLGVYANDGRHWDHDNIRWKGERTAPEVYASNAKNWVSLGARIIGGCCGTAPEHIARLKEIL